MPSAAERINRLIEVVQIMRGMFDANEFSYEGLFWKLKDAYNYPLPIQKPLEIKVGATKPHLIRLAARNSTLITALFPISFLSSDAKLSN
jgi:alkanesulfonate monooxygenase SsuD/methylene tetrahydromethanopterin reductase-like flavin-dependent oxidoreductase (luciferase family)